MFLYIIKTFYQTKFRICQEYKRAMGRKLHPLNCFRAGVVEGCWLCPRCFLRECLVTYITGMLSSNGGLH